MYFPDFKHFNKLAKNYNIIPVYTEITADCETPVSTFIKLAGNKSYAYLLESVEGSEFWGRYSFISFSPKKIFKINKNTISIFIPEKRKYIIRNKKCTDPLEELKSNVEHYKPAEFPELPRFFGGIVGFIGYEMIHNFENIPEPEKNDLNIPDSIFMLNDIIVIFDHLKHRTKIVVCTDTKDNKSPEKIYHNACLKINNIIDDLKKKQIKESKRRAETKKNNIVSNMSKSEFISKVKKAKKYIRAGDIIQVVLSQRFSKRTSSAPFDIYRTLRTVNPSSYMYYLNFDSFQIVGSSPEILVRKEGNKAETRPIAGTRPRGESEIQTKKYEHELRNSVKEKAEHVMLVDLGRNDLGKVCEFGSVRVKEMMEIEKYSYVMHLVSSVTGKLKKNKDSFDLFRACFPAGTVTGAPKIRAMEIISELEKTTRGPYAGAVGYFSFSGNMDMAITIRTILYKKGICYVQAGAGIVADSNPLKEFIETQNKAKALFVAIEQAEQRKYDTCNR